jgi:hypothetical protein
MGDGRLHFRNLDSFLAYKGGAQDSEVVRHFFGEPQMYPCLGIEEVVDAGGGRVYVYLVDFAYLGGGG